ADAVAATHHEIEPFHDRSCAKGFRDAPEFAHQPAGALAFGDRELHVAGARPPLGPLLSQPLQAPHAPFVARATRLDALADPGFLLGPELVELAPHHGF